MKKLIVELEFDEVDEDGYVDLSFEQMKILASSTITEEDRSGLAERWAQSDWYWVGFCNSFISMLDSGEATAQDVEAY